MIFWVYKYENESDVCRVFVDQEGNGVRLLFSAGANNNGFKIICSL